MNAQLGYLVLGNWETRCTYYSCTFYVKANNKEDAIRIAKEKSKESGMNIKFEILAEIPNDLEFYVIDEEFGSK